MGTVSHDFTVRQHLLDSADESDIVRGDQRITMSSSVTPRRAPAPFAGTRSQQSN